MASFLSLWYSLGTLYLTLLRPGQKLCLWIRHNNGPPLALGVFFPVWGAWHSVGLAHLGQGYKMAQESGSRSEPSIAILKRLRPE